MASIDGMEGFNPPLFASQVIFLAFSSSLVFLAPFPLFRIAPTFYLACLFSGIGAVPIDLHLQSEDLILLITIGNFTLSFRNAFILCRQTVQRQSEVDFRKSIKGAFANVFKMDLPTIHILFTKNRSIIYQNDDSPAS